MPSLPDARTTALLLALLVAVAVAVGFARLARAARLAGAAERTARAAAERRALESARFLEESQQVARLGTYHLDISAGRWTSSRVLDQIFGIDGDFGRDIEGWLSLVHPDDRDEMSAYFAREVIGRGVTFDREYRVVRRCDGEVRWVHGRGELRWDDGGRIVAMFGTIQDVSQHKTAEAMLFLSQRLEGIGRLAGGVAHDFNNILGVILGQGQLVRAGLGPDHPLGRRVDEVLGAAERAAKLTRQLLAFSRRQVLKPRAFSLNAELADMQQMLLRIVGEDVRIDVHLAPDLGHVRADPVQIEQVVMNLVVNARDAMPKGGVLVLETANATFDDGYAAIHPPAQAGPFVMLAVSDTGIGMDAETQRRIFEPFFTTKPHGQGTGLGLATVYGIVKQSGGYVWVYSEPGHGTTFRIYLPRADEPAAAAANEPARAAPIRGSETILLVEDTDALREVTREILEGLGYRVLEAVDGEDALVVAEAARERIDLLLTDVVMPRLSGGELARRLTAARPSLKVLLVSGYTDESVRHHLVAGDAPPILEKPFDRERLGRAVREAIDRPAPGERRAES